MSYYSYHGQNKKRIEKGEFMGCKHTENYNKQGERYVLYFCTEPLMRPIKPLEINRYSDYPEIMEEVNRINERI